ncbi:MAG: penicillin-binding transpeptidase domain-containing protein, partial [Candidatus Eisenbacteria bacterium]|nr:penicillin-binding transpeptidase domain-containing protein [Candidatus Eisenbacteria bacterium]
MQQGILSEAEGKKALAQPVRAKRPPDRPADAAYFLDAARREVERRAPRGTLEKPGTMIFTTLDPRDQAAVVASLRKGLEDLEKDHRSLRRKKDRLQGAAIVMDPTSGEVRALVGGRDYAASPFNRAIDAQRQPGSLFKPFVYLAAFQNPRRRGGGYWTPATVVKDEPIEIRAGRKMWRPKNYDRQYRGEVTVRQALAQSLNVPTAYVANLVGIRKVAEAAHDLGIESELDEVPSLSLGTSEVTLLEICSAYAALADEGRSHAPTMLRGILDGSGKMVMLDPLDDPPGVGAPEAYLVTRLLEGVIDNGTGRRARSMGIGGDVAGKTGTTDDYRDAWFIGFTPRRLAGVWVGYDRKEVIGLSGSAAALPIWGKVMLAIRPDRGDGEFQRPPGIVTVAIDPESGMLATSDCPGWREEEFLEGTEPQEECDRHGGFFDSI